MKTLIPPLPTPPSKAVSQHTAVEQPMSQADYEQGCYGLALFFLTILIPIVLGISLCHLFTGGRSK